MNCQACKDLKWILFILAWNHLVAVRFLSTVFTVSAQRVNIVAEVDEQPVQFMIRGDLKNVECIIPLIHHMYRSFLRVVHLKSLLIFGSRLKRRVPFSLGLITQTSYIYIGIIYIYIYHLFPILSVSVMGMVFWLCYYTLGPSGFLETMEKIRLEDLQVSS